MTHKIRSGGWSGLVARLRSLREGVAQRTDFEAEMEEEFRHHIEMRAEDLVAEGMLAKDALTQARREFGLVETHKATARASRGLDHVDELRFTWLDVKTGVRMLTKYPGLTVVAVLALAIGLPVGMLPSHLASVIEAPLPEDEENRIRALRYWNQRTSLTVEPTSWELQRWQSELESYDALGAVTTDLFNVQLGRTASGSVSPSAAAEAFSGARMTASSFSILGVQPILGRTLLPADEPPGAPPVVVLGEQLWENRLGSDSEVVGQLVSVGGVPHTVVGIMPEVFAFPMREKLWLPLQRENPSGPFEGSDLSLIGRLAAGVTTQEAQAELDVEGERLALQFPDSHRHLEPEIVPFAMGFTNLSRAGLAAEPGFYFFQGLGLTLLLVTCLNVAMLIFARTATRWRELAVRGALGASRARVLSQMFAETLVLVVVASALGLLATEWLLDRILPFAISGDVSLPYWVDLGVTWNVVIWTVGLALLSAVIAGVAPGWNVTREQLSHRLASLGSGGADLQFGRLTGTLIVADVAIAAIVIVVAAGLSNRLVETLGDGDVAIAAEEYLTAEIRWQESTAAVKVQDAQERRVTAHRRLLDRLRDDPALRSATIASGFPRMDHPGRRVEVEDFVSSVPLVDDDGEPLTEDELISEHAAYRVRIATIDIDYFDALGQPILDGRSFDAADLEPDAPLTAIVDQAFIDGVLEGHNPVGRRLRFVPRAWTAVDDASPWYEIVGVVPSLGLNVVRPEPDAGVYLAGAPGEIRPMRIAVHAFGDPEGYVPTLREHLLEVDPTATLIKPTRLDKVLQRDWYFLVAVAGGLYLLVGVLVALAASAIFAMITFAVTQRTREIGIRNALGASKSKLVGLLLRRTLIQLVLGTAIGLPFAYAAVRTGFGVEGWSLVGLASTGLVVMVVIGLVACTAPTLRALRIEPTKALRVD